MRGGKSKVRIAKAALSFIKPDSTCFFDSGTTVFAIAEAFAAAPITPVRIVTSNIPVGELLASIPNVEVYLLAGQLLHRQSVLLGDTAKKSLEFWRFDAAFLSAEGMNAEGLWNSQAAIVEQQRVLLKRTQRAIFCMDKSKVGCPAPHFLADWNRVDLLLTDASIEKLKKAGIDLPDDHCVSISGGAKHSLLPRKRLKKPRQPTRIFLFIIYDRSQSQKFSIFPLDACSGSVMNDSDH